MITFMNQCCQEGKPWSSEDLNHLILVCLCSSEICGVIVVPARVADEKTGMGQAWIVPSTGDRLGPSVLFCQKQYFVRLFPIRRAHIFTEEDFITRYYQN